ncbi:MAG: DUF4988 domain-containing protein [Oscillibacter sp.]|nr:DUF4988 domain-containing protein [Oscillibacter sp.]
MKKLLLIAIAFCTFTACDDDDNSELWDEVKNQGNKIEMLESEIEALKLKIEGLNQTYKAISEMLNGGLITGVEEVTDGDKKGYTFTVQTGTEINTYTIWNGETVAAPQLGVEKEEETGLYYWTLDGEPLLNADGEKIYSAKAPQLRINSSSEWEISYDDGATWKNLGVFTGTVVGNSIEVEVVDGVVVIKQDGKTDIEIPLTPKNTLGITFKGINADGMRVVKNGVYLVEYELENASAGAVVKAEMLNGSNFEVENLPADKKIKVTAKGQNTGDVVLVHVYDGGVCMHTSFTITPNANIKTIVITEPNVFLPLEEDNVTYTVNLTSSEATTGNVSFDITSLGTLPAGAVTIPSTVTVSDGQGSVDVVVDRTILTAGKAYTLQLVFSGEDADYQVDGAVMMTTGALAKIQLTSENYYVSNVHGASTGKNDNPELCDNNDNTFVESTWSSGVKLYGDETYGVYIDVVLPDDIFAVKFRYDAYYGINGYPNALALGAENDGGLWVLLGRFETQKVNSVLQWDETSVYSMKDKSVFNKVRFGMTSGSHLGEGPANGDLTGFLGGGTDTGVNYCRLYGLEIWGLHY